MVLDVIPAPSTTTPALPAGVVDLVREAAERIEAARSTNTVRKYREGWEQWSTWCAARGVPALPAHPLAVVAWLESLGQGHKVSTIAVRLAAVNKAHEEAGAPKPGDSKPVRDLMHALRVTLGTRPRRVRAVTLEDLRRVVAAIDVGTIDGLRDRALLLIGFACALRRSEIAAIKVEHVTVETRGARLLIPRSKTDQEGAGAEVGMKWAHNEICPIAAWQAWVAATGLVASDYAFRPIRGGRLYRERPLTPSAIAEIVKRRVGACGLDPVEFSGHSLRAGFATSAAVAGKDLSVIAAQTRHRSLDLLHETYIRPATVFERNATDILRDP